MSNRVTFATSTVNARACVIRAHAHRADGHAWLPFDATYRVDGLNCVHARERGRARESVHGYEDESALSLRAGGCECEHDCAHENDGVRGDGYGCQNGCGHGPGRSSNPP